MTVEFFHAKCLNPKKNKAVNGNQRKEYWRILQVDGVNWEIKKCAKCYRSIALSKMQKNVPETMSMQWLLTNLYAPSGFLIIFSDQIIELSFKFCIRSCHLRVTTHITWFKCACSKLCFPMKNVSQIYWK